MSNVMETRTWTLGNPDAALLAGGVVLLALLLLLWSASRSPLQGWRRLLATHAKLAAIALVAALLLDPQWVTKVPRKGANDLALIADNSMSLALLDRSTSQAIGEPLRQIWKTEANWQKTLTETYRVQRYTLGDQLKEAGSVEPLDYMKQQSHLVSALDTITQRYAQRPLAAAVIFTDGNATDAAALTELMQRKAPAPLYLVATGLDQVPTDLALLNTNVTQSPFEDSPVAVNAEVRFSSDLAQELTLVIKDEAGKVVSTQKEKPAANTTSLGFHVRFRPITPGVSFYTAEVRLSAEMTAKDQSITKEITLENNRRVFAVDRKRGPYRVLYVSGRPNWEYKFLRRALEADDEMKLVSLIRIARREPKFQWIGRQGEQSNPLFRGFKPADAEEVQRYDKPVLVRLGIADKEELASGFPATAEDLFAAYRCVIIDDLEAEFFTREQMDLLERYVSLRGGSLLMLGGQETFREGGYANTPIARMLPVYLDRGKESIPVEDARFELTREGWLEPWMRLRKEEQEERTRLGAMTPFFSLNATRTSKPGASVLATVSTPTQEEMPAWVTQRFGAGRVTAVTIGDLWRWAMKDPESHADFDKAWRQLLRHLVVDVPDRTELRMSTAQKAGDRVQLQMQVRNQAFEPQDEATVNFALQAPGTVEQDLPAEQSLAQAGLFETSVPASASGVYRVKAVVKDAEDKVIGEPVTGWTMNPLPEELQHLQINRTLLEQLATWSGGKVIGLNEVQDLAESLPKLTAPLLEARLEPLWHQPWWWLLLVLLLGTEWFLRRRAA
jgi:uncharacterized membrane protein